MNLVYDLARHESSIVQWLVSKRYPGRVRLPMGNSEIYFLSNLT